MQQSQLFKRVLDVRHGTRYGKQQCLCGLSGVLINRYAHTKRSLSSACDQRALNDCMTQDASQEALLAHQRGDYGAAARLVSRSAAAAASFEERACALDNLGCIQARQGRRHTAALCFSKALALLPEQTADGAHACGMRAAVLYNGALQALLLGRPATALRCFREVAGARPQDPLLWLRAAESCMSAAAALAPDLPAAQGLPEAAGDSDGSAGELLEQAAQCLANALAASAWVALRRGDPHGALEHVQPLLQAEAVPLDLRQAALGYAAEALAALGRAHDAAHHLDEAVHRKEATTLMLNLAGILQIGQEDVPNEAGGTRSSVSQGDD
ncbi:hypothetical protein WJX81_008040 [Elliptochloris bilobata]|uniref:CCR4-NOT transcription complex subunit 10 n=1 Tax=Elliptochloris bilobata TaxID=381761 RepID=A0AAW1S597_9CHLO